MSQLDLEPSIHRRTGELVSNREFRAARMRGRVAIVTGASRGIGFGIARRLVAEGARVCLTARTRDGLDTAVAQLGGPEVAIAVEGSSHDTAHQSKAIETTIDRFGGLHVLVNNTGVSPALGPMLDVDVDAARRTFDVNVLGALSWIKQAHSTWLGEHGGSVVNVSSVAGIRPTVGLGLYGATKAALILMTQQLGIELGPRVRVNAVAPAMIRTQMSLPLYEGRIPELSARYPIERLGEPEDIAAAVAYLASDDAAWITGQTLVVDGGLLQGGGV